jgi:hypothetical protein
VTGSESPGDVGAEPGWLAVNLRVRYEGSFYTEGAVSFVEVRDAAGEIVGRARSKHARVFFRRQLTAGEYDVRTFLRPCDGSCKALDAPREECRLGIEMLADGSNRFVTIRVVAVAGECAVSDKGDVIDLDTDVSDYVSFTEAVELAGLPVRHRERTGGLFPVLGQLVYVAGSPLIVYEFPRRAELRGVMRSISPDGTTIPAEDGGLALVHWAGPPHFFGSGRLLVLYLGERPVVLDSPNLLLGPQFAGSER